MQTTHINFDGVAIFAMKDHGVTRYAARDIEKALKMKNIAQYIRMAVSTGAIALDPVYEGGLRMITRQELAQALRPLRPGRGLRAAADALLCRLEGQEASG